MKSKENAGGLTPKQAAFCREYLVDLNAAKAAVRAGYSKRSAKQTAHAMTEKSEIQAELLRLMSAREVRTEVTADTVLRELVLLAKVDLSQAFNKDGSLKPIHEIPEDVRRAIASVESFEEFEGRGDERKSIGFTRKLRFWDKTKALELLGRHLGMFRDRVEHSGPNGGPITTTPATSLTPEQIAQVERIRGRREAIQQRGKSG